MGKCRDIKNIDVAHLKKIKKEIEKLIDFPGVKNIKKLTHHPVSDYRLRIGNYRVLFDVDYQDKTITLIFIQKIEVTSPDLMIRYQW